MDSTSADGGDAASADAPRPVDDASILHTISRLVEDEHALRAQAAQGSLDQQPERRRLAGLEKEVEGYRQ